MTGIILVPCVLDLFFKAMASDFKSKKTGPN